MNRRGFVAGLGVMLFAPVVVRAASLMPVHAIIHPPPRLMLRTVLPDMQWRTLRIVGQLNRTNPLLNGVWTGQWANATR